MTKEELIQFLKDNLSVRVTGSDGCVSVSLFIGDDLICIDEDFIDIGESHVW